MSAIKKISVVVAIAVAAMLPTIWPNPYYIHLMVVIGIYAILLLGLDIVVGYIGEVSLGHAALFGIGAYTAGVLNFQLGVPFLLAVPASVVVTAIFGAILALPALRVNGPYLAMVTLAFGTIIQAARNFLAQADLFRPPDHQHRLLLHCGNGTGADPVCGAARTEIAPRARL
jgi:ABC-type branched-subunit amino acid transport system permease subunit